MQHVQLLAMALTMDCKRNPVGGFLLQPFHRICYVFLSYSSPLRNSCSSVPFCDWTRTEETPSLVRPTPPPHLLMVCWWSLEAEKGDPAAKYHLRIFSDPAEKKQQATQCMCALFLMRRSPSYCCSFRRLGDENNGTWRKNVSKDFQFGAPLPFLGGRNPSGPEQVRKNFCLLFLFPRWLCFLAKSNGRCSL